MLFSHTGTLFSLTHTFSDTHSYLWHTQTLRHLTHTFTVTYSHTHSPDSDTPLCYISPASFTQAQVFLQHSCDTHVTHIQASHVVTLM